MKYDICVIGGAGRVGLPLSILFALKQKKTIIYDINQNILDIVKDKKFPYIEKNGQSYLEQALESKNLFLSNNKDVIKNSKILIFTLGTPVDDRLKTDNMLLDTIQNEFIDLFSDKHTIIMRSTVFPGFNDKLKSLLIKNKKNCDLLYCPERIAQGNAFEELSQLPQILSGYSDNGIKTGKALFKLLCEQNIVVSVKEAELAKLFNNAWRYFTFACSNEFFKMCDSMDVDYNNVYKAVTFDYPRASDMPKSGFSAGPCLYKDSLILKDLFNSSFTQSCIDVNESVPHLILKKIQEYGNIQDKKICILGMTFKKDIDDIRGSLSFRMKKILKYAVKKLVCYDPFIEKYKLKNIEDELKNSDIIILCTPHTEFKDLKFDKEKLIDIWGFFK